MSARKYAPKQNKQKEKEKIRCFIQNVIDHWPDLRVSEELLQNPTTDFVKPFYARFNSEFEKVTNEIRTNILEQEPNPDPTLFNEDINLAIKINKLCKPLGIPFNLNDMCEPQPQRTVLFFTMLMNLVIFLKSKNKYENDIVECVQQDKHYKELKTCKNILMEEIENLKEFDIKLDQDLNALDEEIENLNKEYKEVMVLKTERDFKYQQDFKVIKKLKEDIKACDDDLSGLREESASLQEQIVSEDVVDKLKDEIQNLKKEYENLDANRTNMTSILEEQEEKAKYYKRCLLPLENSIFSSNSFISLKDNLQKLTTLREDENKTNEMTILKITELKHLQGENSNLKENLHQLQKELENLNEDTNEKIATMNLEFNDLVSRIKEEEIISKDLENENKKWEQIRLLLMEEIATVRGDFIEKYEKFITHKQKIQEAFDNALLNISKTH